MKIHPDEQSLLDRGGRPTLADLLEKMTFSPTRGSIELNGTRLVLTRATFLADLQDELVRRFGDHAAKVLLLRLGYRNGREDAEFIRQAWPNLDVGDAFTAGTRLHMVTGTVRVETLHNDFDFRNDKFSGDFLWHQSMEATEYARRHGRAVAPVCWTQTGYAAGYASVFFRKLILYKEVSCAAMGDKSCRVVGKTVEDWGQDDPFVRMFLDEVLNTRAEMPARARKGARPVSQEATPEELIVAPVRDRLARLASVGLPALITGPEGSGRATAARWLHAQRFPGGDLHRLHGSAATLVDLLTGWQTELRTPGAPGRTLVIDDIETMPPDAQVALLPLVQPGTRLPVLVVGVARSPAARSQLHGELWNHLNILPVTMPALRDRRDTLGALAECLLAQTVLPQMPGPVRLCEDAHRVILHHPWTGGVPELRATLLRAALCAQTPAAITADELEAALAPFASPLQPTATPDTPEAALWSATVALLDQGLSIDAVVGQIEDRAVQEADGVVSVAARRLGLTRAKLDYRIKARGSAS